MARLTLYGIYQFDPSLFDLMVIPEGMDRNVMLSEIMQRSGDLYPYYQVPEILKKLIGYWFVRRRFDFQKMLEALTSNYNPIENYDRKESFSRNFTNSGADNSERTTNTSGSADDSRILGSTQTTTYGRSDTETRDTTDITSVSAFNSSSYEPREKREDKGTLTHANSGTDTVKDSATDTAHNAMTSSATDKSVMNYGSIRDENENNRIHGNIGVTTNQQMIEQELAMRKEHDLYAIISALFEKEFIVQLY